MTRINLRQLVNISKIVTLATFMITFVTACNNDIQLVSIYKTDGSLQCHSEVLDTSLEEMQQALINNDIQVHHAAKSNDGLMHLQLCGSPTGNINVFKISESDIEKAQAHGFILMVDGEENP